MNKPALLQQNVQFNFFGLRRGQASLYKHLEYCAKNGMAVESEAVAKIYWTEVRDPEGFWDERNHWFRIKNCPDQEWTGLKNKDVYEFFSKEGPYKRLFDREVMAPTRQWMKSALGSLVMRGMLQVIPKLDTTLLEK